MAESTLTLVRDDFRTEIAQFLGYGVTLASLTTAQSDLVDRLVGAGLRQFYYPPPMAPTDAPHEWTFLHGASFVLNLTADRGDYDLPDDCASVVGDLTYIDTQARMPIKLVGLGAIREERSGIYLSSTAPPNKVAIVPKSRDGTQGQRWQALFSPVPDASYSVRGCYQVEPHSLTSTRTLPYGGPTHSETIKASCLAMAEEYMDGERGVMYALFLERLRASVAKDVKRNRPESFGYNGDGGRARQPLADNSYVRYNGQYSNESS